MKHIILSLFIAGTIPSTLFAQSQSNTEYVKTKIELPLDLTTVIELLGKRYRSVFPQKKVVFKKVTEKLYLAELEPNTPPNGPVDLNQTRTHRDRGQLSLAAGLEFIEIVYPKGLEIKVSDLAEYSCPAYWSGFTYDLGSDSCKAIGASGCTNPFEFATFDHCNTANLLD